MDDIKYVLVIPLVAFIIAAFHAYDERDFISFAFAVVASCLLFVAVTVI